MELSLLPDMRAGAGPQLADCAPIHYEVLGGPPGFRVFVRKRPSGGWRIRLWAGDTWTDWGSSLKSPDDALAALQADPSWLKGDRARVNDDQLLAALRELLTPEPGPASPNAFRLEDWDDWPERWRQAFEIVRRNVEGERR